MVLVGYDANYITCITWGVLHKMTWAWFHYYCDEAYALVSNDWIKSTGLTPTGLTLAALEADEQYVKQTTTTAVLPVSRVTEDMERVQQEQIKLRQEFLARVSHVNFMNQDR